MDKKMPGYIIELIILVLAQVLICNHIVLFNVAMPFIFIYVIIRLPMHMKAGWLFTWAFFSGFAVDLFSDTPGVNSLACLLLAACKHTVFFAYTAKDDRTKETSPALSTIGVAVYSKYLLTMSALYCLFVFSIEYFSFAGVKEIVIMSASSALYTFLLLMGIDSLIVNRSK